jgi:SAM-dependent methyltransferase
MVILDIGCGKNKVPGSIGVDIARVAGVDVVGAVERLPFKDNTADVVYLSHVLEHVDSLVGAMEEIWRVCKHGALVHIWGPHFSCGLYTWSDPTHRRAFTSTVFDYFDPTATLSYYSRARFRVLRRELHFGFRRDAMPVHGFHPLTTMLKAMVGHLVEPLANLGRVGQLFCERTWAPWIGFEEIYVQLRAVKE